MIYIVIAIALVIAFLLFKDLSGYTKDVWQEWTKKQNTASDKVEITPPPIDQPVDEVEQVDNFQRIYGIGPRSEKALHQAGINRFEDLANADVTQLEEIIEMVNPLIDPDSWPAQAALAAAEKWDEFKVMYEDLQAQEKTRRQAALAE